MQLQTASRKKVKLRLNLASPSGFGNVSSPFLVHIKSKLFSFVLLLESMGRSVAKA